MTTEEEGRRIAEKLNYDVVYSGAQRGPGGEFFYHLFTDEGGQGYTFAARGLREAQAKFVLKRMETGGQIPVYPGLLDPLGIVDAADRDMQRITKSIFGG